MQFHPVPLRPSILSLLALIFVACTTNENLATSGFSYKTIPVTKKSTALGEGASIHFRGNPLALVGSGIKVGDQLRSVKVARTDLSLTDITESKGRVRLLSIVPSLDTKVCEQQTHYLSEKNNGLDTVVDLVTVSIDTPFAQDRFSKEAGIHNVTFLSDYRDGAFGRAHGLLLDGPHLLARAILVIDRQNIVRYLQVTPDLGTMPDMDTAFEVARQIATASS